MRDLAFDLVAALSLVPVPVLDPEVVQEVHLSDRLSTPNQHPVDSNLGSGCEYVRESGVHQSPVAAVPVDYYQDLVPAEIVEDVAVVVAEGVLDLVVIEAVAAADADVDAAGVDAAFVDFHDADDELDVDSDVGVGRDEMHETVPTSLNLFRHSLVHQEAYKFSSLAHAVAVVVERVDVEFGVHQSLDDDYLVSQPCFAGVVDGHADYENERDVDAVIDEDGIAALVVEIEAHDERRPNQILEDHDFEYGDPYPSPAFASAVVELQLLADGEELLHAHVHGDGHAVVAGRGVVGL